ncbi:MAG: response regulator [Myxococcales bacterium]|nr:response regulator [Myxococcales bacterium]MCB9754830.1 response regulator [Myxococcales bacterium]
MKAHILIVDDNVYLAENVAELFEEDGAEVTISGDGASALARARERAFDLAIVDVRLPDMTGVELVPNLRRCSPHGEVLLMTGNASLDTAIEAVRQGVFAYVQKPFAPDDMLALAERALAQVELRRERSRLAVELSRSEQLHRGVVETVASLIIGIDPADVIVMWNPCATEVTGWTANEALGRELLSVVGVPEQQAAFAELLGKARAGERTPEFQSTVTQKGGGERTVRWNLTPLRQGEGAAAQELLLVVGIDVTERLDLEKRAADAEAMASLATLTTALAHEIRNPLNAAILQLELLSRIGAKVDDERARRRLGNSTKLVQSEIRRLSRLLEEFLGLARPRSLDLYPVELHEIVGDVVGMQGPVAESAGVELRVGVLEDLPHVMGDRAKLTQVLINLLVNAIDALREREGGLIEIDAELSEGGRVIISLSDNGPGIGDKVAREVFRPFFSTKETGTGLGLAIVKKIVDQHGGQIELVARPGGGTVARVSLKRAVQRL